MWFRIASPRSYFWLSRLSGFISVFLAFSSSVWINMEPIAEMTRPKVEFNLGKLNELLSLCDKELLRGMLCRGGSCSVAADLLCVL